MEVFRKGEVPFVWILIPLISGILIAHWFRSSLLLLFASKCLTLFLLAIVLFLVVRYRKWQLYRRKWFPGTLVFLLVFLVGYIRTIYSSLDLDERHFCKYDNDLLVVVVNSEPKATGNILRFEATVTDAIVNEKVLATRGNLLVAIKLNKKKLTKIAYGTQLLIPASFTEVEPSHNPSEFDYKKYLSNKAIYHQIFIEEGQVKILQQNKGDYIMTYAIESRQNFLDRFSSFMKDKDAIAIASTLILGYRADLSEEVIEAYTSTGTMHVLSVSGMHVGIIFLILSWILGWMDTSVEFRVVKAFVIIALICAYSILTGLSAAACRAALMISFLILGKTFKRNHNSYNLLAVSAVILLIYNPFFLVDIGFQLSYLAVLGLIYLYPKIYNLFCIKNWILDKVWAYSALSISAQVATFPISMFYFHQFPVYFLLGNLLVVIPVALIMYIGMVFILIPVDVLSPYVGWLLEQCIVFANMLIFKIDNLPGSTVTGIWLNVWEYLLIYLLVLLLLFSFIYKMIRLLLVGMMVIFILICGRTAERILLDRSSKVIFYSLRKNYAIGLLEGRTAYIATDLKENDKTFSFSIKPYLEESRIEKINLAHFGEKLETRSVFGCDNFMQFRNWKMFVLDKKAIPIGSSPVEVNLVLIRNNSLTTVKELSQIIKFKQLIFDCSNYDTNIQKWVAQSKQLNLNHYVLKKNSSMIIDL